MPNDSLPPNRPSTPPEGGGHRASVVALLAIGVLAILMVFLVSSMQRRNAVQTCIDSGRRDCVPLPTE